ncbi:MAG: glycoside hydrolase family 3 C-terminal domain-containing protein [Oscillospiraceae bacterium]|nr:glycoside hydrolase family 3 C-terminal domain-containing protein [Oscillospiraceae bacterium]
MKKKTSHLFRGAASIFLALLMLLSVLFNVASAWEGKVNELLGTETATIKRSTDPEDYPFRSDYASAAELVQAEIAYATRLQAEGSVALKGTPAISGDRITLFGMRSNKLQYGGSMGELIDPSNVISLAEALESRGFAVNPDFVQFYRDMETDYAPTKASGGNVVSDYAEQGAEIGEVPAAALDAGKIGDYKDAAVIVLGRDAGESCCFYPGANGILTPEEFTNSPTGNIFSLSNDERDLVSFVKAQGFGKVLVLINAGTSMEIDELKQDEGIDSILWIGNPGAYGTYGIAELLRGNALPSGHLPDTFAVNSALSPAAQNVGIYVFDNADAIETTTTNALRASWYLAELEGIYTGYKYYETRYFDTVLNQGNAAKAAKGQSVDGKSWDYDREVSYPFGFGLEGSSFTEEITDAQIDWSGETDSSVTVRVTNTGAVAAKHAVQLYVSLPYTEKDRSEKIEKSAIQLIGYAKTGETQEQSFADVVLLERGKSEDVVITFNAQDFYTYDRAYAHDGVKGSWMLERGDYYFATGNGAHEAVMAVLREMGQPVESSGAVHKETLSADSYFTASNDTTVQNRLDQADLNNTGAAKVTYLSRSDWFNTFPKSLEHLNATEEMIYMLRNATYNAELAAAGYDGPDSFVYGKDNGVRAIQLRGLDYDDPLFEQALEQLSLEDFINQYIAYFEEMEELAMPIESRADSPLGLIATIGQRTKGTIYEVDENDEVYKRHTDVYPGGPVLAASFSPLLQREEGRMVGNDGLWTGYNTWFGPGMNLHRSPYNGRNMAYYSEDSVLTGRTGAYVSQSLNEYGMVTNIKHFAFNDQETNRDGLALFLHEQAARENELRGFQIGIRNGGITGLMSAFNRIGCVHVGASEELMNGILRGEWGWNGFMMTDSVKSTAYFQPRECAAAGNDQMLGGSNNAKVWNLSVAEVEKDVVLQSHLRESYHRKLFAYVNSSLLNGIDATSSAGHGQVWWKTVFQVGIVLTALGFAGCGCLFLVKSRKERSV